MNMEAFILGCGGMMPLPGRHLTSMLLRREGDLFLFDAGEGTQVSLRALNLKWKKINAIFISHTHADHVTGLPGMLMLSSQVDRSEPLYIIGPPRVKEYVDTARRVLDMYINYDIVVQEIKDPTVAQTVYEGDGFNVRAIPLRHTKVCVGYVLQEDSRPGVFSPEQATALGVPRGPQWGQLQRGETVELESGAQVQPEQVLGATRPGRKVSYVTDSLYLPSIVPEVKNSDLLICEGMFHDEFKESAHEKRHMTASDAGRLAAEAGVRKVGLIHYSPRYTDRQLKILLKEAQNIFPASFLTRDRMVLTIPYIE
ncbi:MAG: ribonuclease Z [Spirochaetaceae bacterium]|nr:MAG: ribonuclease Z [Spirochaetaceae bacterium]